MKKTSLHFQSAEQFLELSNHFRLGHLMTEQGHDFTKGLDVLCKNEPGQAFHRIRQVDIEAIGKYLTELRSCQEGLNNLVSRSEGNVYLGGCGATGRLSMLAEFLSKAVVETPQEIRGFTAGGDVALVHALEGFEDQMDFGARQLTELGYQPRDTFFGITEGGETPFVIGATHEAAEHQQGPVAFLYCNPTQVLTETIERSKQIIDHPHVRSTCLATSPMALAGSTRMQATSIQLLSCLESLFGVTADQIKKLVEVYQSLDEASFGELVAAEADVYQSGGHVHYCVAPEFALSVFTDTTERAPTFSLSSFEPKSETSRSSLCYISVMGTKDPLQAWQSILGRAPRPLDWEGIDPRAGSTYLTGFDFSEHAISWRQAKTKGENHLFEISRENGVIELKFQNRIWKLPKTENPLLDQVLLKLVLNNHSTSLMGRMGRFKRHFMTFVKPSNGKLIDRVVRYTRQLLEEQGQRVEYDQVVHRLFEVKDQLKLDEPIVLRLYESFRSEA